MTAPSLLQTARHFVSRYWDLYRDRAESRNELAYMTPGDIEVLAADCGLSPSQFRDMMKRGPRAADELLELMKVLDIDEARRKAVNRGALNDMKLICAECGRKSECRGSLRRGTASREYRTFCNNSELLDDARRLRPSLVA